MSGYDWLWLITIKLPQLWLTPIDYVYLRFSMINYELFLIHFDQLCLSVIIYDFLFTIKYDWLWLIVISYGNYDSLWMIMLNYG